MTLSPVTRRRLAIFRQNRRGYVALWIFVAVFGASLFAEFIANDRPLLIRFDGHWFVPVLVDYSEDAFGAGFMPTEAVFLHVLPRSFHADAEVAEEEVVHFDTAAPAVVAHGTGMGRAFADGVLTEDAELEFVIVKARLLGHRRLLHFLAGRDHRLPGIAGEREQADNGRKENMEFSHDDWDVLLVSWFREPARCLG